MAEDTVKVYTPQVIEENPFPQEESAMYDTTQSTSKGNYSPETTTDQPIPPKRIAIELLSTALNTKSKKITQEFQFTEMGAIQIGKYIEGVSGDTRISANGLVMRNKAGETTIAQDGDTGDALFAGQIRAGSTIVSDSIITQQSSEGNGRTVYLINGVPAIVIGDPR